MRQSTFAHRAPARRKRVWADYLATTVAQAGGTTVDADILSQFVTAGGQHQGATIQAVYWTLDVIGTGRAIADYLRIGFIVNATDAAPPDPVGAAHADWMLNLDVITTFSGAVADGRTLTSGALKSRRKLDEVRSTLKFVRANVGATAVTYRLHARVLLLLP